MTAALEIGWVSLFADVPAADLDRSLAFWSGVTGWPAGAPTGEHGELVPLVSPEADRYLYLQRTATDQPGWHLDLHVSDVDAARQRAELLGASPLRTGREIAVLRTPAGQPFCLVPLGEHGRRVTWRQWPDGQHSLVDQLCLDIPAADFERDTTFWAELTGWRREEAKLAEFRRLTPPATLPVKLLLQRLGPDDEGGARAHADLACDGRPAETARHEVLGASVVGSSPHGWTVLRDPAGLTYCITDHRPH